MRYSVVNGSFGGVWREEKASFAVFIDAVYAIEDRRKAVMA